MSDRTTLTCDEIRDLAPLFVTGALDPDEMDAVREHLAGCDDAHAELLELGEAATSLLETVEPADPPAALKSRLLAAAEADLAAGRHPSTAASAAAASRPRPGEPPQARHRADAPVTSATPVVDLAAERTRRRSRFAWVLAAAAVIVAVALGGWNIALNNQLSSAQAYRSGVEQALDLAAQPGQRDRADPRRRRARRRGFGVIGADGTVKLAMRGMPADHGLAGLHGLVDRGGVGAGVDGRLQRRIGRDRPGHRARAGGRAGAGDGHHPRAERRQHGAAGPGRGRAA